MASHSFLQAGKLWQAAMQGCHVEPTHCCRSGRLAHRQVYCTGLRPTLKDWETHLTTIFPEVRLKRYMEMRGGDGGPLPMILALPAFWVGLLYDR